MRIAKFIKDVWRGEFVYRDDIYENSEFWNTTKDKLCGYNKFGNFYYLLWGDLDCTCCAFTRGLVLGTALTTVLAWLI